MRKTELMNIYLCSTSDPKGLLVVQGVSAVRGFELSDQIRMKGLNDLYVEIRTTNESVWCVDYPFPKEELTLF